MKLDREMAQALVAGIIKERDSQRAHVVTLPGRGGPEDGPYHALLGKLSEAQRIHANIAALPTTPEVSAEDVAVLRRCLADAPAAPRSWALFPPDIAALRRILDAVGGGDGR